MDSQFNRPFESIQFPRPHKSGREGKIEVYDPRGNDQPNAIRKYQIFLGDPTWQASYPKSARRIPRQSQDNGVDCGVFVCLYASYLMNNQTFDFTQSDIPDMRKWLAYRIARG